MTVLAGLKHSLPILIARHCQKLRFALAGAVNTAFGLAIYPVLLWSFAPLQRQYLLALAIAQVLSLSFAFAMYKWTVFRTRANLFSEMWKFSSFYLINYAINWIALPLLVETGKVPPITAQFGFSLLVMVSSYFWHSRLTFRPKRNP